MSTPSNGRARVFCSFSSVSCRSTSLTPARIPLIRSFFLLLWFLPTLGVPLTVAAQTPAPSGGRTSNVPRPASPGPGNPAPEITAPANAEKADKAPSGFFQIVFSGGLPGFLIILLLVMLSICGLALVVEHLMTIRQDVLMPSGLDDMVAQHLARGDPPAADLACQQKPSVLAFILRAGLAEVDGGWPAIEKATEDVLAEQAARLLRKVEYLSVLGNIAPMVGLLGTVIGMIFAFQEVADTQGAARAAELASGIYQALVTTVGGLLVAIPSLATYAIFRSRVDQLVAEMAYTAQHALLPIKRSQTPRRGPPPRVK